MKGDVYHILYTTSYFFRLNIRGEFKYDALRKQDNQDNMSIKPFPLL